MKKDKQSHQPVPEVLAPKVSSVTLTLQLLNKEKEKHKEAENKESSAEAAKVRCKTCFKEIAPKRLCSGHGAGGGGGASEASDKASDEKANPAEDNSPIKSGKVIEATDDMFAAFDSGAPVLDASFDLEIIADLIAKGLLLVDNDRDSLTLTIQLLCKPDFLTKEQEAELQKFMEAILTEFNAFKQENDLSSDCLEIIQDEKGNKVSLRITMPTLALYDAFIQRLANNLVPIPGLKAQEKDEITKDKSVVPTPLAMEPKPSNKDKPSKQDGIKLSKNTEVEEPDEEKQGIFNPSPFNMKPW